MDLEQNQFIYFEFKVQTFCFQNIILLGNIFLNKISKICFKKLKIPRIFNFRFWLIFVWHFAHNAYSKNWIKLFIKNFIW